MIAGAAILIFAFWAIWMILNFRKNGGISGCLLLMAARNERRAASQKVMARWWIDFRESAIPHYRQIEKELQNEAIR